ncbi:MAG: hypothetical protein GYA36_17595, partial [Veillonellaceae bacterium]|nr:hypothetical protein [Veillonellaceae bacterium]
DNLELAGDPLLQRAEAGPNLSWDEGNAAQTPAPPPQTLAARYVQSVVLPAGSYRLRATTNAGVRLYVDDQLLLDAWDAAANAAVGNMATLQRTYTTAVLAGGAHTVRLEVRRVAPDVSLQVFWEPIL